MFNEEKNAGRCVDSIIKEINKLSYRIKLFVVNDGSKDKTLSILKSKKNKYKNKLEIVSYKSNGGYGYALKQGISKAAQKNFDYVLFMDSDLTNDPKDIYKFIESLKYDPDCVKASRYIKGGGVKGVPLKRQIISRMANFISSLFFGLGIKDCTNGFRMVKLSKIKYLNFRENSFPIIVEELYQLKKNNAKIIEVPVILNSRKSSKSSFSYKPMTFINYGKYVIKSLFA